MPWYLIGGFVGRVYDTGGGGILIGVGVVAIGAAICGIVFRLGWLRAIQLLAAVGALVLGIWQAIDIARLAEMWGVSALGLFGLGIPIILVGALIVGWPSLLSLKRKRH